MTKQQATLQAKAVLARIHESVRSKWKIKVHENLGWHWKLASIDSLFTLRGGYNGEPNYSCLLSDSEITDCGCPDWSDMELFDDPNEAIRHTVTVALNHVAKLNLRVRQAAAVCPLMTSVNVEQMSAKGKYRTILGYKTMEDAQAAVARFEGNGIHNTKISPVYDKFLTKAAMPPRFRVVFNVEEKTTYGHLVVIEAQDTEQQAEEAIKALRAISGKGAPKRKLIVVPVVAPCVPDADGMS